MARVNHFPLVFSHHLRNKGRRWAFRWKDNWGTKGAVRVRDTIFIAAQLSWDEHGNVTGDSTEAEMRQAYANVGKLLETQGAKWKDLVEETLFVTDMKSALAVAQKVKLEVFGESPTVASSIVQVSQLADPKAHVAIRAVAKLDLSGRGYGSNSSESPRGGMRGGLSPF